jgi:rubrerythrin
MKNGLSPEEFLKLREQPQPTKRYFECGVCGLRIYVAMKPASPTVRCPQCKTVWKLHTSFASGTGAQQGVQLPYVRES